MAEQKNFLSSQGTEVNKNSISYTSFVSPQNRKEKEKKKREKKIKKRSGARLGDYKSDNVQSIWRAVCCIVWKPFVNDLVRGYTWKGCNFIINFYCKFCNNHFVCHYWQWPILITCEQCYCLCVLRWLIKPILALNCLLQMEQQRSEQDSSVGDVLALALRCARFCSASLILFASYSLAPLLMRPRHFARSNACSHDSVGMLKKRRKRENRK